MVCYALYVFSSVLMTVATQSHHFHGMISQSSGKYRNQRMSPISIIYLFMPEVNTKLIQTNIYNLDSNPLQYPKMLVIT